jgi:hypothetical protein
MGMSLIIDEYFNKLTYYKSKINCIVREIESPERNKIYMFDESSNPTGTHKDRIACFHMKEYLKTVELNSVEVFPDISIISSGSSALALQKIIDFLGLKIKLKVLIDYRLNFEIKRNLENLGCILYESDLSLQLLSSSDILTLTNNKNGIESTNSKVFDNHSYPYYTDLYQSILKYEVEYCFLPFGSGELLFNLLFLSELNHKLSKKSTNFYAATVNIPDPDFNKLFSYFSPNRELINNEILRLKNNKLIGKDSNIYLLNKKYLGKALELAEKNNLNFEYSALAGLLLYIDLLPYIQVNGNVGIILTGNSNLYKNYKSTWLKRQLTLKLD